MWTQQFVTSLAARRVVAGSLVTAMLVTPSVAGGQSDVLTTSPTKTVTEIKTGLLSFMAGPGRYTAVQMTELGPRGVTSNVRVTFFDAANQVVFKEEAVLERAQPVYIALPLDMAARRVSLRVVVRLVRDSNARSLPVMILEDVDGPSFTIEDRVSCAPPEEKDGTTPYCPPPAMVNTFTIAP
jgi:hypothetical protein